LIKDPLTFGLIDIDDLTLIAENLIDHIFEFLPFDRVFILELNPYTQCLLSLLHLNLDLVPLELVISELYSYRATTARDLARLQYVRCLHEYSPTLGTYTPESAKYNLSIPLCKKPGVDKDLSRCRFLDPILNLFAIELG
jgi:hypothetical protein